ncbi:glycosyltransferase, partial [Escherichia coli]
MKMPRVICIIVTFNREHLLQQTLDAVLNQTFPLQNIIVIDNNSFDNTRSLVSKLSENNPKIE